MKLRNLNGAIRKLEGAPTVGVMTPLGYIYVPVQKTGFLDALKSLNLDPQAETHMELGEDGRLILLPEGRAMVDELLRGARATGSIPFQEEASTAQPDDDDLLDMGDDDTLDIEESPPADDIDLLGDL